MECAFISVVRTECVSNIGNQDVTLDQGGWGVVFVFDN